MQNGFLFEMRLSMSKRFPPGASEVVFGQYSLRAIPTGSADEGVAVLSFQNNYHAPEGGGSHPEHEALHFCHLLSLCTDVRVEKKGIRANAIDIPTGKPALAYRQFAGILSLDDVPADIQRVLCMNDDLARQFLRAAKAYSSALDVLPQDITFAFFLLVVSIECMASQDAVIPHNDLHRDRSKCERFCHFIMDFIPDEGRCEDEQNEDLLRELLKTTYYVHRSAFVHGGREVSFASLMADQAGSTYFKHHLDGKEVRTPGIGWFASVARRALLGYLRQTVPDDARPDPERLARLAFEKAGLRVKAKRSMERGMAVTFDDVEYR